MGPGRGNGARIGTTEITGHGQKAWEGSDSETRTVEAVHGRRSQMNRHEASCTLLLSRCRHRLTMSEVSNERLLLAWLIN